MYILIYQLGTADMVTDSIETVTPEITVGLSNNHQDN